jgi:hexosaminidase
MDLSTKKLFTAATPVVLRRGIHLDLTGLPPTAERLLELLELFAAARYNVVLVQWEDSYPWTVDERFRSPTAYSPEDIVRFRDKAAALGLELIPLVQCLGHMETPLSVPGYEHLRELPDDETGLNPLAPGARELIQSMVDDVLKLMPDVRYFHLGGDEARTFGQNPETEAYIDAHGKGALYLHHVEPVLDALNRRNIRPILWHDMMVDWDSPALTALGRKCDLMVWGYDGHPDIAPATHNTACIERFVEHGMTLWGASAYKGCEGNAPERHSSDLPDLAEREENALAWAELTQRFDLAGVLVTAWSRWGVDTVQCVPIDAALDALLMVASCLHDGHPPAGGLEACLAALEEWGERARFDACRSSMERLTDLRRRGWIAVMHSRQQLVLAKRDSRRPSARNPRLGMKPLAQLGGIVKEAERLSNEIKQCFAGLLEPIWIEEYLATRLTPFHDEYAELRRIADALPVPAGRDEPDPTLLHPPTSISR